MQKRIPKVLIILIFLIAFLFIPIPYRVPYNSYCVSCLFEESCPICLGKGDIVWTDSIAVRIYKQLTAETNINTETIPITTFP